MTRKYFYIFIFAISFVQTANSQVLISLLFGDKLNTEYLKFGLIGGYNTSNIRNFETGSPGSSVNLGFYFDLKVKEGTNWFVHSAVYVKSTYGINLEPYSLDNEDLDNLYENGSVRRRLQYWHVPFLGRYKFDNNLFVELGPMFGLLYKGTDVFKTGVYASDDLTFNNNIKDEHHTFDVGLQAGLGYQFDVMHGLNVAVKYYYGLMNTIKDPGSLQQRNSAFYVVACIPVGAGEKAKAKNAAAAEKKAAKKAEKEKKKELKDLNKKGI